MDNPVPATWIAAAREKFAKLLGWNQKHALKFTLFALASAALNVLQFVRG